MLTFFVTSERALEGVVELRVYFLALMFRVVMANLVELSVFLVLMFRVFF